MFSVKNLVSTSFHALLSLAMVSCTQTAPDVATSGAPDVIGKVTQEKKTVANNLDKRHQDVTGNSEGILLSQADMDGDNLSESIAICETASICVNHPVSGINHIYTHPSWERLVLLAVNDTDGTKGSEIVIMARTADGVLACICIIHDRSQAMTSYLGPQWSTVAVRSVNDTDGEPGDEVVLVAYDSQGVLQCACIIRDRDGTYQTYIDPSWASVDINWVEDTDAKPGAEVVLEVKRHNGTRSCICVIHHKEDRLAKYSDPRWQTATVQMCIDTDGESGREIVVIYSSEFDGGVSIIHDRQQSMKTITFAGDHPSIQQVDNYDNAPGAELCVLLVNRNTYELINDRPGEHVKIDNCQREQGKGHA